MNFFTNRFSRSIKDLIRKHPYLHAAAVAFARRRRFQGSREYWERRYLSGGTSGAGSSGRLAQYKATFLNNFVAKHGINSVAELGCGDGEQLGLANYADYLGIDVSAAALTLASARLADRPNFRFCGIDGISDDSRFDMALSLDVIFHLVEDDVFTNYMQLLFSLSERFVVIYSSDCESISPFPHVRHRNISTWISKNYEEFELLYHEPNPYPFNPVAPDETSFAEFHVYGRRNITRRAQSGIGQQQPGSLSGE